MYTLLEINKLCPEVLQRCEVSRTSRSVRYRHSISPYLRCLCEWINRPDPFPGIHRRRCPSRDRRRQSPLPRRQRCWTRSTIPLFPNVRPRRRRPRYREYVHYLTLSLSNWSGVLMCEVMRDEIATTTRLLGVNRVDQLGPHLVSGLHTTSLRCIGE